MPRKSELSQDVLEAALQGLEAQRQRIGDQIAHVRHILGTGTRLTVGREPIAGRKRTMSATARRRIAAAQKKRWQEFRKRSQQTAEATLAGAAKLPSGKRTLSPTGRRAIAEAARKRWAAVRAAKGRQNRPSKKTAATAA